MKKVVLFILVAFSITGCNQQIIEKPDNLIDRDNMVNILYDLAVLDAIKSQNMYDPTSQSYNPKEYIYKKYKVDSLQLAQSNRYYVSQIEDYKKIYDEVNDRLTREKKVADSLVSKGGGVVPTTTSDTPQIQ